MGGWDEFITYGCPWEGAIVPLTQTHMHVVLPYLPNLPRWLSYQAWDHELVANKPLAMATADTLDPVADRC